jgi:hypothetical protein
MAIVESRKLIKFHASMIVDEELLSRINALYKEVGWIPSGFSVKTKDGRTITIASIDDLKALPDDIWLKIEELEIDASKSTLGDRCHSSFEFHKARWYEFVAPVTIWIRGNDSDVLLLERRFKDFIPANREWYSPLSRGLWWMLTAYLLPYLDMVTIKIFHKSLLGDGLSLAIFIVSLIMTYGGRQWLFPGAVFPFGSAQRKHGNLVKQKQLLAKVAGTLLISASTGMIGIGIKRFINQQDLAETIQSAPDASYSERPLPDEIIDKFQQLPLAEQVAAVKAQAKRKVNWEAEIKDVRLEGASYKLMMLDRGHYPWLFCDISVAENSEAQTWKDRQKVQVWGTISTLGGNVINIQDCHVKSK